MERRNVAKINLEIRQCSDCPFARLQSGYDGEWYCVHDLNNPGLKVEKETVPDWCPFVLERLQKVLGIMQNGTGTAMPKKWLNEIMRKQRDDPDPKFGADHTFGHIDRVVKYGENFLEECVRFGVVSNNEIQRLKLLLRISAMLHDVGLADSSRNHEIHSAELAKKYLLSGKLDIDDEDVQMIVHAIFNHSKGNETRNALDAALIIGDKLDVTKKRIVRETDAITVELKKVEQVEYKFFGWSKPDVAELRYTTNGEDFDVSKLSYWPKALSIPERIAREFLGAKKFRFLVDGNEVDVSKIF